jgi:hypothetical protein
MGKIFGILVIILGIWIGLTIYTEGTHQAFGGIFASFGESGSPTEVSDTRNPLQRIRERSQQAQDEGYDRVERALKQGAGRK